MAKILDMLVGMFLLIYTFFALFAVLRFSLI